MSTDTNTPVGTDTPTHFQPAHTRTLSNSHTRTLSSTHAAAAATAQPSVQTIGLAQHSQQLTSIPADLPQLMVTTPTTIYSAYTQQSTPSSFGTTGTPFSPPMHVPDVPPVPEVYRQQQASPAPAAAAAAVQADSPPAVVAPMVSVSYATPPTSPPAQVAVLPDVVVTNPTPPAYQARFASPMTANPNMPVLPRLATPGSGNVARKPVPELLPTITTVPPMDDAAIARVKAGTRSHSPPGAGSAKTFSPPARPYAAGSISTMSPVAAARSFNQRRGAPSHIPAHTQNASIDSPTAATANLYSTMKGQDKPDRSLADKVVGRETLFDLDVDSADGGETERDAKELPLEELMSDELPEYIQVYLTPHPDRDEKEKKAVLGGGGGALETVDEKGEKTEKTKEQLEYERRAVKWNDIEATLPAYKSTASVQRAGRSSPTGSAKAPAATDASTKKSGRRCIPRRTSTRVLCIVILLILLVAIPLIAFGVVYSLQNKAKSNPEAGNSAAAEASTTEGAGTDGTPGFDPNNPVVKIEDGPPVTPDDTLAQGGQDVAPFITAPPSMRFMK